MHMRFTPQAASSSLSHEIRYILALVFAQVPESLLLPLCARRRGQKALQERARDSVGKNKKRHEPAADRSETQSGTNGARPKTRAVTVAPEALDATACH